MCDHKFNAVAKEERGIVMDEAQIFSIIKQNLVAVLPELANRSITLADSLQALGANSVDRADILIQSMADLKLKIPLVAFGQAKNIGDLVTIFLEKK